MYDSNIRDIVFELVDKKYISFDYGNKLIENILDDNLSLDEFKEEIFRDLSSNVSYLLDKTAYLIMEKEARELFMIIMSYHFDGVLFNFNNKIYKDKEDVLKELGKVFSSLFDTKNLSLSLVLDDYIAPRIRFLLLNGIDIGCKIRKMFVEDHKYLDDKILSDLITSDWDDLYGSDIVLIGFHPESDEDVFKKRICSLISNKVKVITYCPPDIISNENIEELEKSINLSPFKEGELILRWSGIYRDGFLIFKEYCYNIGKPLNIEEIKERLTMLKDLWKRWNDIKVSLWKDFKELVNDEEENKNY